MNDPLVARVRARLIDAQATGERPAHFAQLMRDETTLAGDADLAAAMTRVAADVSGFGVLDALLRDPSITDIVVNGPDEVWIDDGVGMRRAPTQFDDDGAVRRLAQRLLAGVGARVDLAHPYADAVLPGGVRLHVTIPPVSATTLLSLRVLRRRPFELAELGRCGTVDQLTSEVLRAVVTARLSVVVSGATGAGKTTFLGALLGLVAVNERIVVIEDAAEISHAHPHAVHLSARGANADGAGTISLTDLVRQSLRMRPDRLIVGEARGAEVLDLLRALNTGHAGSMSTVHANSPSAVPQRLRALAVDAGLDSAATDALVVAGVDAIVHLGRDRGGARYVAAVALVTGTDVPIVRDVVRRASAGSTACRGPAWAGFAERCGW